jgi:chemotaxis protein CheC
MTRTKIEPTAEQMNRLQKVAEIGMANAGQGLSEMTGNQIDVAAPKVELVPLEQIPIMVGGPDILVVGIYLSIVGDLTGHVMLMLSLPSALALVDTILEQPIGTTVEMDAMAESALAEVGNLTGSFFITALGDRCELNPQPSPPAVVVDMSGAILDVVLADLGQEGEEALMIETSFRQSERAINGFFLCFPNQASLETIFRELRA